MPLTTEKTTFTRDVQGRYLCNDLTEVNAWKNSGGRPFDVIVIGGGNFRRCHRRTHLVSSEANWRWAANAGRRSGIIHDPGTRAKHRHSRTDRSFTRRLTLNENAPQPEKPQERSLGHSPGSRPSRSRGSPTRSEVDLFFLGRVVPSAVERGDGDLARDQTVADLNGRIFRRKLKADRRR